MKDPSFTHALKSGVLWQSLCSQHVHFPALWYDGDEPARPPMGCSKKGLSKTHSTWQYLGRHRVQGDVKLNSLIGNRGSSGRLLLHILVIHGDVVADLCVGCFHPNARGIRTGRTHDPALENCRDVWMGYRRRGVVNSGRSRLEALLQRGNKGHVDVTPLGGAGTKQAERMTVDNHNLRVVFGDKPPLFTLLVQEEEIYRVLHSNVSNVSPASIVLMRHYMRAEAFE